MPSKSKKQRRFMAAAANNPKFAKKAGIKQSVAREFHEADKRRGYAKGGVLHQVYSKYFPTLSKEEIRIIENTSGAGVDELTKRELSTLRRLIREAPRLPEETRTYRSDNSMSLPRRVKGGYPVPTTLDPELLPGVTWGPVAEKGKDTYSVIDLPEGSPALFLDTPTEPLKHGWPLNVFEESELLLPPGGSPRRFQLDEKELRRLMDILEIPRRGRDKIRGYRYDPPYKARGGPVGVLAAYAAGGVVRPRYGSTLGTTAKVGGLGDALGGSRPRSGFSAPPSAARRSARPAVGALGGTGAKGTRSNVAMRPSGAPSKLRPRPGRGANGVLALAGTPYYQALDRRRQ